MDISKISYNEYIDEFRIGRLIIRGLELKVTHHDNPLVIIWTTIRKRIFDKVGISVVGYFDPDRDNPGAIKGKFYLSYPGDVNAEDHFKKFEKSFHKEMDYFEKILTRWLEEPDGYATYLRIKEKLEGEPAVVQEAATKAAVQNFLRIIRVRKKDD
ncbi:hypothetical protein IJJ37_00330 [Candidatus Saccharibacteria bacterium]|nr:hypothetical protein [Candidatus Saccharibacteria bacterium]